MAQYFVSGNDILLKFKGSIPESSFAMGYVTAVADAKGRWQFQGLPPPKAESSLDVCFVVPSGVAVGQLVDISRTYLERNPGTRHFPAAGLIGMALQEVYPCK